jgi:hypothetical protein
MLLQILASTPRWVFGLFLLLLVLGLRQLRPYRASLTRIAILPVAMKTLAVYGVVSAFGGSSAALVAWVAAASVAVAVAVVLRRPLPETTRFDAVTRTFEVTGSVVPLALMMGIFFTKYVVAVQLAMHPYLAHQTDVALVVGAIYGAFSGIFAARGIRLWMLALRQGARAGATASLTAA